MATDPNEESFMDDVDGRKILRLPKKKATMMRFDKFDGT
jgi:hypothetical protein